MYKVLALIGGLLDPSDLWEDTPQDRANRKIAGILNRADKTEQKVLFDAILKRAVN